MGSTKSDILHLSKLINATFHQQMLSDSEASLVFPLGQNAETLQFFWSVFAAAGWMFLEFLDTENEYEDSVMWFRHLLQCPGGIHNDTYWHFRMFCFFYLRARLAFYWVWTFLVPRGWILLLNACPFLYHSSCQNVYKKRPNMIYRLSWNVIGI